MSEELSDYVEEPASEYGTGVVYNIKDRAFNFSKKVVLTIGALKFDKIYFSIFDQLIRSATSVGANLVEARAGSSVNDFLKLYDSAKVL